MPMIKKERFTFWIPAFDLVSKVNACVEKVLDRNIHDVLIQSPQLKEGEMSFLLFWVRLRFGLKQITRDYAYPYTCNFKKRRRKFIWCQNPIASG